VVSSQAVHLFLLAFVLALPAAAAAPQPPPAETPIDAAPIETPIMVPSPIPVGFLIAWKPALLSVRADTGVGSRFGSDKLQPFRFLGRYTTMFFDDRLLARAEVEGGQFQTDTQASTNPNNVLLGSDGYDVTARLLGGTAVRLGPGVVLTGSAGFITRYQGGRAESGAPRMGAFGFTSNLELEHRLAPSITLSVYFEGGIVPFPFAAQKNLGDLSDSSELRARLQVAFDVSRGTAIDVGFDFTRWHTSFSNSSILSNNSQDRALLIESRDAALTIGVRFKPVHP
jgi:hypothetical protein